MLQAQTAPDIKFHLVGIGSQRRGDLEKNLQQRSSDFAVFKTVQDYEKYASAAHKQGEALGKPEILVLKEGPDVRAEIEALSRSQGNVKAVLILSSDPRREMSELQRLARTDFQILAVDQAAKPEVVFHSLDALIKRVIPDVVRHSVPWGREG